MLRLAALVPLCAFLGVATLVGVRLLLLGRGTRQLPELAMGLGLVLISLLGMPLAALARLPIWLGNPLADVAFAMGLTLACTGIALIFVFTWSVFRRHERWATALVIAASLALSGFAAGLSIAGSGQQSLADVLPRTRPWALGVVAMVILGFGWTALESLHYWRMLRRRLVLGLADPIVANRFLLWAISGGTTALLCTAILACLWAELVVLHHPLPLSLIALMGSVVSIAWYLSFFPPEGYRRAIRARHTAP